MPLEMPKSTRYASISELMPCSSGVEVDHLLVGHGWLFSWAVAGIAPRSAAVASKTGRTSVQGPMHRCHLLGGCGPNSRGATQGSFPAGEVAREDSRE